MTVVLATVLLGALVLPHVARLDRAEPTIAMLVWLATLTLRALTGIFSALFVLLYLPTTELFRLISQWCWHTVLPFLATHLGLEGHDLGDFALIAPSFFLAVSTAGVLFGLWRAARRVHALMRSAVGPGPERSVLLGDGEVLVAAAGFRHPRVVISAGALLAFDDEELAASLDHERGHIARRHRWLLLYSEVCRALGRIVPGTRAAARELRFHLERDADRFALERSHDPAALASAICKTVGSRTLGVAALGLSSAPFTRRVEHLLDPPPPLQRRAALLVASVMVSLALAAAAVLPMAAHAGWHQAATATPSHHCPHHA